MPRPDRPLTRGSRRAAGSALGLAVALACGPPEAAAPPTPAPPPPAREAERRVAPRLGVERNRDGTFRVQARRAPRVEVLDALARAAGFATRPGVGSLPPQLLDLELREASAEDALARVLADVPHHLHYGPREPGSGRSALLAVTVGRLPEPAARAAAPASGGRERSASPPADPGWRPQGVLLEEDRLAEIEARRASRLETDRALAASLMRPDERDELEALLDYVGNDPSPLVRRSAAEALADVPDGEQAFRAADALLAALGDGDPGVVEAAVRSLEDVHDVLPDPRIRRRVAALASHRDERVREAVASLREWTEEE